MLKGRPHQIILLLLIVLLLTSIGAVKAHAQIRAASLVRVGNSITCNVGPKPYPLTPDKNRIRFNGNSSEIQDIFDRVARHSGLTGYVYTVPVIGE